MKKFLTSLALLLILGSSVIQAQTVTESWAFGFGFNYPRFYSVNVTALNTDYGAYLSLQRNFSEHVGLRLKVGYSHLEGEWNDAFRTINKQSTNLITGDLDLLYYLVPCAPVSPYLYAGVGGNYKSVTNGQTPYLIDDNNFGSQFNVGLGAEFKIDPSWAIVAEFGYHITNNSELEGSIALSELNGRDSYVVLGLGVNYFFDKGKPSPQCEPCQGLSGDSRDMTDYGKIENMIIKHIPKEVVKEVIVDKYIIPVSEDRLVLVGVNFAFDKSDLLPESYPVLDRAVLLLKEKSDVRVEIEGYTDYKGTDAYNQELSIARAITVKDYLIAHGIADSRLSTIGYGEGNPVADNTTEEGRTMNRRIVFRILK